MTDALIRWDRAKKAEAAMEAMKALGVFAYGNFDDACPWCWRNTHAPDCLYKKWEALQ